VNTMEETNLICGTCKYCLYKLRKNLEIPRDGYCYGNPPYIGGIRPKVGLKDGACRLHVKKTGKETLATES